MTRNTRESALITVRTGLDSELPTSLHKGEFGLSEDSGRLFIGLPDNPQATERTMAKEFPYANIEILTENSPVVSKMLSYENLPLDDYITTDEVTSKLEEYATNESLENYVSNENLNVILSNYITKEFFNNKFKVVDELPAVREDDVFYFVKEQSED